MTILITDNVTIREDEIAFKASRSGGPGGQNVNKVSSRVTLSFDAVRSPSLTQDQKLRIRRKLSNRINKQGVLQVVSQRTRSQEMNRADALERFAQLLRYALRIERPRIRTKVPKAVKERRLEQKKRRTTIKGARSKRIEES